MKLKLLPVLLLLSVCGYGQKPTLNIKVTRAQAEKGDATAQFHLGQLYESGQGLPQDQAEAVKWYRMAGEQGNADAQASLGIAYYTGRGVPKDHAEAVRWWRKSAEQGNAYGENNLGTAYNSGRGVPQDHAEAVRWWRKSAEQGNTEGQIKLGLAYEDGLGVAQDYLQAYTWVTLAAWRAEGDDQKRSTGFRDKIASKMTSSQIAEAEKLAIAWEVRANATVYFPVRIAEVRSLPTEGVGFSKGLILYGVNAVGPQAEYLIYCVGTPPQAGRVYTAFIDNLDAGYSMLRLWPVEKADLDLPPGAKKKGRLYRMMIIRDVRSGQYSNPACDIKTETALQ